MFADVGGRIQLRKVNNRVNSPNEIGIGCGSLRTHRLNGSQAPDTSRGGSWRVKTHEPLSLLASLLPFRVHEFSSRPPFACGSPSGYLPIGKVTFIWISLLRLRSAGSMGRENLWRHSDSEHERERERKRERERCQKWRPSYLYLKRARKQDTWRL